MGRINVLDKQVAELIAAGEVVERPASVVKELVENAIDAGATVVTVEIKNGGVTLIRVTDNGSGILREDVPVALLRHATSKLLRRDDLDCIGTLGFRGEALASIAAVSRLQILTRTADEEIGTGCRCEGGENPVLEDAGCPVGTTVLVRDLFFNTPARMKFLKKDVVEGNAVAAVLDNAALSHPEISFRLIRDGRQALHTPGDNQLRSAVYSVCGREFTETLMPVAYELGGIRVDGFTCKPAAARATRSMQRFFINGRFVRSRTAMTALEEGYKGSMMVGKFPACVLHITLPAGAVDVNVHPAKLEVRFVDERPVFNAVYHAVRSALMVEDTPRELQFTRQERSFESHSVYDSEPNVTQLPLTPQPTQEPPAAQPHERSWAQQLLHCPTVPVDTLADSGAQPRAFGAREAFLESLDAVTDEPAPPAAMEAPAALVEQPLPAREAHEAANVVPEQAQEKRFHVLGEAFKTYIIVQRGDDELVLIDKHAAHERMLYDRLREEHTENFAQTLLTPVPVTLEKNEYAAVLEHLPLLAEMGFETEDFGDGTVLVRTAPLSLAGDDIVETVREVASYLLEGKNDVTPEHLDWIYHNMACRAAVKGGTPASDYELTRFVQQLLDHPEVRYCPHGRPVYLVVKRRELEKQFGRLQ